MRRDGHLIITVLAHQFVQLLHTQLEPCGIHYCWSSLREMLTSQRRATSSFRQCDGDGLQVRKSSVRVPELQKIHTGLGLDAKPGGVRKPVT